MEYAEIVAYLVGFPAGISVIMEFVEKVLLKKDKHERWYLPITIVVCIAAGVFATLQIGFSLPVLVMAVLIIFFEERGWDWQVFEPIFKKLMKK